MKFLMTIVVWLILCEGANSYPLARIQYIGSNCHEIRDYNAPICENRQPSMKPICLYCSIHSEPIICCHYVTSGKQFQQYGCSTKMPVFTESTFPNKYEAVCPPSSFNLISHYNTSKSPSTSNSSTNSLFPLTSSSHSTKTLSSTSNSTTFSPFTPTSLILSNSTMSLPSTFNSTIITTLSYTSNSTTMLISSIKSTPNLMTSPTLSLISTSISESYLTSSSSSTSTSTSTLSSTTTSTFSSNSTTTSSPSLPISMSTYSSTAKSSSTSTSSSTNTSSLSSAVISTTPNSSSSISSSSFKPISPQMSSTSNITSASSFTSKSTYSSKSTQSSTPESTYTSSISTISSTKSSEPMASKTRTTTKSLTSTATSSISPSKHHEKPGIGAGLIALVVVGAAALVLLLVLSCVFKTQLIVLWRRTEEIRKRSINNIGRKEMAADDRLDVDKHLPDWIGKRPWSRISRKVWQRPVTKPRTRRIPLREFAARVAAMKRDGNYMFEAEYESIVNMSKAVTQNLETTFALEPRNVIRNRYFDIIPFDVTRVKLEPKSDYVNSSDYINANYIKGFRRDREYISTQGPIGFDEEIKGRRIPTMNDYWKMIWQEKVEHIVMLTQCVEASKKKCAKYWPKTPEEEIHKYNDFTIKCLNIEEESEYDSFFVIRTLQLQKGDETRELIHWQCLKWPDMQRAEEQKLLIFVDLVRRKVRSTMAPMVVHCSAGVGRTGCFIALDIMLQSIVEDNFVDVFACLLQLRSQRVHMVQTEEQYMLLYDCLQIYISNKLRAEDVIAEEERVKNADAPI